MQLFSADDTISLKKNFVSQNIEKLPSNAARLDSTTSFQSSKFLFCETETALKSEIFSSLK